MTSFEHFVAIDYSGAGAPTAGNPGIAVWEMAADDDAPRIIQDPKRGRRTHWSRSNLHEWICDVVAAQSPRTLIGIDHGFSWPVAAMDAVKQRTWEDWLGYMNEKWGRLRSEPISSAKAALSFEQFARADATRSDLRLTEKFSSSAKSVFNFNGAGVALSTLAGLPWLDELRRKHREHVHFWPFDHWEPASKKHCIVEIYPSLFSRRYPRPDGVITQHPHDAAATCQWMKEAQQNGWLPSFFSPFLSEGHREQARREGWILGIL